LTLGAAAAVAFLSVGSRADNDRDDAAPHRGRPREAAADS
jgi:hypothetical protein